MDAKDWFNYGVPTTLLVSLGWFVVRVALWARDNVAQPVVKAHLELIATLREHVPKQTAAVEEQTGMLRRRDALFEQIIRTEQEIKNHIDEVMPRSPGNHPPESHLG